MVHVGVLSPVTGGFFFGEVLAGVVREVGALGGHVTLVQTLDAGRTGDEFIPSIAATPPVAFDTIDGFITIAWATPASYLDEMRAAGKTVVVVSNDLEGIDATTVVTDNDEGVRAAVDHLVAHGHDRIGFVGNIEQSDMRERHDAYKAAMRAHGLDTTGLIFQTRDHVEHGGRGAAQRIVAGRGCTAAIAATDRVALGLIQGLDQLGFRVPEDLAVVGFDDTEAGWYSTPPLATVRQRFDDLGSLAARLLVREVRGEAVEHMVHRTPARFIPRRSCGCGSPSTAETDSDAGRGLVTAVLDSIGLDAEGRPRAGLPKPEDADLGVLDAVITSTLERLHAPTSAPEVLRSLTETYVRLIGDLWARAREAGQPWAATLQYCLVRITSALTERQMVGCRRRINRLSTSFDEQYDVGMGLLGRVGTDPADLSWLDRLSVRAGCLGVWEGPPQDGRLRITGTYDRTGALGLGEGLGTVVPIAQFPPLALAASADPSASEATFVIPVRGSTGDHGFLAVVGTVDTEFGTGRAAYDHWAALLGAALREKGLLEKMRRSEERYAFASRAANDGLWEYDFASGEIYLSPRCRDLLGTEVDDASWVTLVHPEDRESVSATLTRAAGLSDTAFEVEYRTLRADGSSSWVLLRAFGVATESGGVARLVGSLSDISQRRELEDQLRHAALFDPVTDLPNRRLFLDRLSVAMEQPRRRPGARYAMLFLDLDGFKLVNDSLGHLAGDQLLQVIGGRLRGQLRSVDTAARFGGDEFALLLSDPVPDELLVVAARIQDRISEPVMLGEHEVSVTASIGIAVSESGYTDAEDVLRDADIAMYHAKETERGSACLFDPAMHERAVGRLNIRSALLTALAEKQFVVHYQPVVALDGAALTQFEALVRWAHPKRGILLPGEFLPAMEGNATIVALGHQVLDQICAQLAAWRQTYAGPLAVSMNLAHREFWAPDLLAIVRSALERHAVPAECIILEITESVIMTDPEAARGIMDELHAEGIRLHIDDFGTGQSSLHALRTFPVDALKIDGSFIRELTMDPTGAALVRTIVAMGDALGLDVVAECVETAEQADALRGMGCSTAQGWLYAKAMPGHLAGQLLGTRVGRDGADKPAARTRWST